jgi:hypothetical protein
MFYTVDSEMGVRAALRAGRTLLPGRFLVLRGCVDARAILKLERLSQLKYPMIYSGVCSLPACGVWRVATCGLAMPVAPMKWWLVGEAPLQGWHLQFNSGREFHMNGVKLLP